MDPLLFINLPVVDLDVTKVFCTGLDFADPDGHVWEVMPTETPG